MVKKTQKTNTGKKTGPQMSSAVKDSAQQIWLAGLGAFSKAQQEGGKVFDALVKEGQSIQRKTQEVAEGKITEAASRMNDLASDIQSRVGNQWDKLENLFEDRVAKALSKLGVPSAREINVLAMRIDQLDITIQKINASSANANPSIRPTAKRAVKSATPKTKAQPARKSPQLAVKRAFRKTGDLAAAVTNARPQRNTEKK